MKRTLSLLLCCAPTLGFTDCDDFSPVTVPSTDTVPPIVLLRLWVGQTESYEMNARLFVDDAYESLLIVPVVYDQGGARELFLWQSVMWWCDRPDGTYTVNGASVPYSIQEQQGGPGSVVSDGLYSYSTVTSLAPWLGQCPTGTALDQITLWIDTTGTDFAGNEATDESSISYRP